MTAKEYLEHIRSLGVRIRMEEQQIEWLRQDICSIQALDYSKDRITGGHPLDVSDKIARLDELIEKAYDDWDRLIDMRAEARQMISELTSTKQQEVLTRRYIRDERWENIAAEMNISWQSTWRLYYRALKNFSKNFKNLRGGVIK